MAHVARWNWCFPITPPLSEVAVSVRNSSEELTMGAKWQCCSEQDLTVPCHHGNTQSRRLRREFESHTEHWLIASTRWSCKPDITRCASLQPHRISRISKRCSPQLRHFIDWFATDSTVRSQSWIPGGFSEQSLTVNFNHRPHVWLGVAPFSAIENPVWLGVSMSLRAHGAFIAGVQATANCHDWHKRR